MDGTFEMYSSMATGLSWKGGASVGVFGMDYGQRAMEHNNDWQIQKLANVMDLFFSLKVPGYVNTGD